MTELKTSASARAKRFVPVLTSLLIACLAAVAGLMSCNQPFDPRAPLDQQLVVYSLLSTDRDTQYVRVNSNYMPSGFDPTSYTSDNAVRDASVTLSTSINTIVFHGTVLPRPDTSRYKTPIFLYVVQPFTPQRGKAYQLLVQSPAVGSASATVVIPSKPSIAYDPASVTVLSNPLSASVKSVAQFTVDLSGAAKGYSGHLYIYYDVLKESRWVEERVEVPFSSSIKDTTFSLDWARYQDLTPTPQSNKVVLQFTAGYLQTIVKHLTKVQYVDTHLIYKWIVLVVLQADQNFFSYFKSIRGYQDPLSIRLDQPVYSSINGAVGMVGAYSLDSLTYVLPENFNGNR